MVYTSTLLNVVWSRKSNDPPRQLSSISTCKPTFAKNTWYTSSYGPGLPCLRNQSPHLNFLSLLPLYHASLQNCQLSHWNQQGISYVSDLYRGDTLKTFSTLCVEYALPQTEQFNYRRIASQLQKTPDIKCRIPTKIAWFLKPSTSSKGDISLFYVTINNKTTFAKSHSFQAWERDL